jgi:hypothetical protein
VKPVNQQLIVPDFLGFIFQEFVSYLWPGTSTLQFKPAVHPSTWNILENVNLLQ